VAADEPFASLIDITYTGRWMSAVSDERKSQAVRYNALRYHYQRHDAIDRGPRRPCKSWSEKSATFSIDQLQFTFAIRSVVTTHVHVRPLSTTANRRRSYLARPACLPGGLYIWLALISFVFVLVAPLACCQARLNKS